MNGSLSNDLIQYFVSHNPEQKQLCFFKTKKCAGHSLYLPGGIKSTSICPSPPGLEPKTAGLDGRRSNH